MSASSAWWPPWMRETRSPDASLADRRVPGGQPAAGASPPISNRCRAPHCYWYVVPFPTNVAVSLSGFRGGACSVWVFSPCGTGWDSEEVRCGAFSPIGEHSDPFLLLYQAWRILLLQSSFCYPSFPLARSVWF